MSLKQKALSSVFWLSLQLFSTQIIVFIISLILARLLVPAEFGIVAMLGIFVGVASVLINGGLAQSLIRTENPDDEDFSTVFYFNLLGSIAVYCVVFFLAPYVSVFYKQPQLTDILRVYAVIFIINAFGTVQLTRLNKLMDFKTQMKVSVPAIIVSGIVGITLAYLGFGVWSLVYSAVVKSLASTMQLWYWAKWRPLYAFSKEKFTKHFNFGFKLVFSGLLDALFTNMYTILIGKFFAPAQVAFYNRADALQMLPVSNISSIVSRITYPLFASVQNDDIRLKGIYKKIMQMVIFLVAPILMIMAVLAEPLFRFLFTEKWLPAVPYFQILCFNGILYPIHSYNLQILNVKGRSDLFLKLEIVKKFLILIVVGISFSFGIFGLLYGGVIASVMCFFINAHYTGKFLNYSAWEQSKDLLPTIFLSIIVGAFIYFADQIFFSKDVVDFVRLCIGGMIGVTTYLGVTYLFKISALSELILILKKK